MLCPASNSRFVPTRDSCHRSNLIAYSITSSARASSDGSTSRPSALAVVRLMTSSNLVGCMTGQIRGLLAFEDTTDIDAGLAKLIDRVRRVAHQSSDLCIADLTIHVREVGSRTKIQ